MPDSLGLLSKAAWRKEKGLTTASTYPVTPGGTDLAANHMIPFSDESVTKNFERSRDPALVGAGGALASSIIGEKCSGSVNGPFRYRGWERMMLCALGFEHPNDSPANLGTGSAYFHLFELDDELMDQAYIAGERNAGWPAGDRKVRRGTLGFYKQPNDHVFQSCYINKWTLAVNPQEVKQSFDVVPYNMVAPGSYNNANWTLPSGTDARLLFQQTLVMFGIRSAGVGGMIPLSVSGIELSVDNKLKVDDQSTASGKNIVEPCRSDMRETTLKLEFPRYSDAYETMITLMELNAECMCSIVFTGPLITGSYYYTWEFYMPAIWMTADPRNISGPGPLTMSWEFECRRPVTTDGFAATKYNSIRLVKDSELRVACKNLDTFNYLTET
jgi:hypothetical protein